MFQDESSEDSSSPDEGIEDDGPAYLQQLRDELAEERQRALERRHAYEAKSAEQR